MSCPFGFEMAKTPSTLIPFSDEWVNGFATQMLAPFPRLFSSTLRGFGFPPPLDASSRHALKELRRMIVEVLRGAMKIPHHAPEGPSASPSRRS